MNTEHERKDFEALSVENGWAIRNSYGVHFKETGIGVAYWRGYQAGRAALQSHTPNVEFEDPRVQLVYGIICGGHEPPEGEHWDGYVSRLIVDALQSQDREDAGMAEIVREAAQIIAAIPPEHAPDNIRWPIVDELEGFASKIDHARRIEGDGNG